jgi:PAS domain S-box-containing protein
MQSINEDELLYIMASAPVGICILNAATRRIETINTHFLKLTGRAGEALSGKLYTDLFANTAPDSETPMNRAILEGHPQTVPETALKLERDGLQEIVWMSLVYSPVKNKEGKVSRIAVWLLENTAQGFNEELAATNEELAAVNEEFAAANEELAASNEELAASNEELLRAQESLRRSEKLFRSIALNIPGSLLIVIDQDHRYITIEGDLMDKLGYDGHAYEGMHPSEISPERYATSRRLYERVMAGEQFSMERQTENGEWYLVHFVPLKNEAGVTDIGLIITLDITAIKQAEEQSAKLAAIVETSDDAIISKTLESVVTSWNAAAERMFGYTAREMIGQTIYRIIPADRQEEEPHILARLRTGERVDHFETKRLKKDGTLLDVSLTISPVLDKQGKIIGLSKIARDITQQKQEEQRKSDFIGMVSHELKTPLTSLAAIIQVAHRKLKNSEDQFISGAMEKANRQVKRMTNMISGFLNISRLEAGHLPLDKRPFDLDQLIHEILEDTRLTVNSHSFDLEDCDRIIVNADRDKIGLVVSNLISNAVKYSPKGRHIVIRCKADNESVVVSVTDEGMGLNPQDIERIFERYYRVATEHTKHISGFGVGLYLSAEIIKRHGGAIWVESESGKGSTFYFSLPQAARSLISGP